MDNCPKVAEVIETLRRQRVRQGDLIPVLDCVIAQAAMLSGAWAPAPVRDTAKEMTSSARDLKRSARSLAKFVVEDLLDEFISKLERAAFASQPEDKKNDWNDLPRHGSGP